MLANLNIVARPKAPVAPKVESTPDFSDAAATPNLSAKDRKRDKYKKGKAAIIKKRAAKQMSKVDQITQEQVNQGLN
jgi:hypothetical protein